MNVQQFLLNIFRVSVFTATGFMFTFTAANSLFAQDKGPVISIADAKKLALGTEVSIGGTVSVASGTFRSSFSDEGFQIEDKTSGMYVRIKTDLHLAIGQRVRLTGMLTETALKFQIVETDESGVKVISGTGHLKPIKLSTGAISERIIGKLIKIVGTVTKPVDEVAPYGFRVSVNDGTGEVIAYVSTSTTISPKEFMPGQNVQLVGVAGKFNEHYQIYPRSPADIRLIGKLRGGDKTANSY
jgi:DNA/RNA endonuclease YhcR with UshA esterase domain